VVRGQVSPINIRIEQGVDGINVGTKNGCAGVGLDGSSAGGRRTSDDVRSPPGAERAKRFGIA
jgi:hypothetical protein